jgi:hypothetical protein
MSPASFTGGRSSPLLATYQRGGASALDVPALAAAYGRLFDVLERHFQALSDQVGGGFERAWYRRLSAQIKQELSPFGRPAGAVDAEEVSRHRGHV